MMLSITASGSVDDVCAGLDVDFTKGLTDESVALRRCTYGLNTLPDPKAAPFWSLVYAQFEDTLVRILLVAAVVSFAVALSEGNQSGFVEPLIILFILTLNAIVGVWQQNHAESAIAALRNFVPETALVVRNSVERVVPSQELVPGDVVIHSVGDRVSADIRLVQLESTTFRVDQSVLNGESEEVMKHCEEVDGACERFPANMIYSGSAVVYGRARGVVVCTGSSTEIGCIERGVTDEEDVKTPLQVKLDEFGVLLSKVVGFICLAVFFVDVTHWYKTHVPVEDESWVEQYVRPVVHCLKVAVALAVAAIPEGLPAVVTTCLALGTRRMARHNALVRDLPSVETLGRCTVICSDKTGTLTNNLMSVQKVITMRTASESCVYEVQDSQYDIIPGAVSRCGETLNPALGSSAALDKIAEVSVLCNNASLMFDADTARAKKIGEATEAALLVLAEKIACTKSRKSGESLNAYRCILEPRWHRDATLEFTRSRKSMSVLCSPKSSSDDIKSGSDGRHSHDSASQEHLGRTLFVKGAPEELLRRSSHVLLSCGKIVPLTESVKQVINAEMSFLTHYTNALRCIGFAFRVYCDTDDLCFSDPAVFEQVESQLVFAGVSGMQDPPREEIRESLTRCCTAGIRVIVITGDKKETAEAVCQQIGLLRGKVEPGQSVTGDEFDIMTLNEKRQAAMNAVVFSRTDASHKLELVKLLQEQGLIVAMTGDGVNDSPALKRADIGLAMGSGTEVAKNASKMILADDNFATIVSAVREGRCIFNNTKQFIRYLVSSNIGEVACVLVTGLFGLPEALSPIQLLWVNLVTDGLPATALGFNSADPNIMNEPPRCVDEPIVNGWLFLRYLIVGTYIGLATVSGFLWWFLTHGFTWTDLTNFTTCADMSSAKCATLANPREARSIALSILVIVEMCNALNALSENQSIVTVRPTSNMWLICAVASSVLLHLIIMYVPFFSNLFGITALGVDNSITTSASSWSVVFPSSIEDWKIVMAFSVPVIFIDEFLKFVSRRTALTPKNVL